jgi:hypothetical protein
MLYYLILAALGLVAFWILFFLIYACWVFFIVLTGSYHLTLREALYKLFVYPSIATVATNVTVVCVVVNLVATYQPFGFLRWYSGNTFVQNKIQTSTKLRELNDASERLFDSGLLKLIKVAAQAAFVVLTAPVLLAAYVLMNPTSTRTLLSMVILPTASAFAYHRLLAGTVRRAALPFASGPAPDILMATVVACTLPLVVLLLVRVKSPELASWITGCAPTGLFAKTLAGVVFAAGAASLLQVESSRNALRRDRDRTAVRDAPITHLITLAACCAAGAVVVLFAPAVNRHVYARQRLCGGLGFALL